MITSLGAGSGLNLAQLVDQLVAAQRQPSLNRLNVREAGLQAKISAFASLQAAADKLRTATDAIKALAPGRSASVSGAVASLTASASATAALGSYSIAVSQLAQAHSLSSSSYASSSTTVGGGTLTITLGTTNYDPVTDTYTSFTAAAGQVPVAITIAANSTLAQVRDTINTANAGVSAVLVGDANGQRLLLSSTATGTESSLEIQVVDDDGNSTDSAGLSALAFNATATNLQQTIAASDASLTINGLQISSHSNQSIAAIDGLSIDLLAPTTTENAVIKVSDNGSAVNSGLNEFAGAYNELVDLVAQLASFDPNSGQTGTLFADTTLRSMMSAIRAQLSAPISAAPQGFDTLIALGIDTDNNGKLAVNNVRLDAALAADFGGTVAAINTAGKSFVQVLDQFSGSDGLIGARRTGVQGRLDLIADDRITLDRRTASLQQRLTRQFANLDTLLSNLKTTSNFISTQLATLNFSSSSGG